MFADFRLVIVILHLLLPLAHFSFHSSKPTTLFLSKFVSDSFTGYISENVALPPPSSSSSQSSLNTRHNRNLASRQTLNKQTQRTPIYVRFVDKLKPSFTFDIINRVVSSSSSTKTCRQIYDESQFKLQLQNIEYDTESLSVFKIENEIDCFWLNVNIKCLCYFRLSLIDSDEARERLNREAKDIYNMRINLLGTNSSLSSLIHVSILDDNDLEPMFDQSEYVFELEEKAYLPPFSFVGRVVATDPDLDLNSHVRYFINCGGGSNECHRCFGVEWRTGNIYLKQSSTHLDDNDDEFNFEINAIDAGLKTSLVKTLLKSNTKENELNEYAGDWEDKLLKLALAHNSFTNRSSVIQSFRLETAQVKVKLKRNVKNLIKIQLVTFDNNNEHYLEHVFFRLKSTPTCLPLAMLKIFNGNLNDVTQLKPKLNNRTNVDIRLAKLYPFDMYLIFKEIDSKSLHLMFNLSIEYENGEVLVNETRISLIDNIIARLCQLDVKHVNNITNYFRLESHLNTRSRSNDKENFCQHLEWNPLFSIEYTLKNATNAVELIENSLVSILQSNITHIYVQANLMFNKTRRILTSNKVFEVNFKNESFQFRMPTKTSLTLKWSPRQQLTTNTNIINARLVACEPENAFYLENGYLISGVNHSSSSNANLLVKLSNQSEYVKVFVKAGQDFEEKNCFVNVNLMPKENSNFAYQVRKMILKLL